MEGVACPLPVRREMLRCGRFGFLLLQISDPPQDISNGFFEYFRVHPLKIIPGEGESKEI